MKDAFTRLKPEKQAAILRAACGEFAEKGYAAASTNAIVERAGISKGSLFTYFEGKQDLFLYLTASVIAIVREEFYARIDEARVDLIERYRQCLLLKTGVALRHPDAFNLLIKLMTEPNDEGRALLSGELERLAAEGYGKLFRNLDDTALREPQNIQKTKELIRWAIEGYGNRLTSSLITVEDTDTQQIITEFDDYLAILRRAFYVDEGSKRHEHD